MKILFAALLLVSVVTFASTARADMGVFGNGSYTSGSTAAKSGMRDSDSSYSSPSSTAPWSGKLAFGGSVSQIVSSDAVSSKVQGSNAQMNLSLLIERDIIAPLSFESGAALGMQLVQAGDTGTRGFSARYLTIPMQARLRVARPFSIAAGGVLIIPTDSLDGVAADKKLGAADLGIMASARWTFPMGQGAEWLIDGFVQSGKVHLSDAGAAADNHVRNFGAAVGMAAKF